MNAPVDLHANTSAALNNGATDGIHVREATCPSSNDLRLFLLLKIGVSGSVWGLI